MKLLKQSIFFADFIRFVVHVLRQVVERAQLSVSELAKSY